MALTLCMTLIRITQRVTFCGFSVYRITFCFVLFSWSPSVTVIWVTAWIGSFLENPLQRANLWYFSVDQIAIILMVRGPGNRFSKSVVGFPKATTSQKRCVNPQEACSISVCANFNERTERGLRFSWADTGGPTLVTFVTLLD